jgi:hypothetical protein
MSRIKRIPGSGSELGRVLPMQLRRSPATAQGHPAALPDWDRCPDAHGLWRGALTRSAPLTPPPASPGGPCRTVTEKISRWTAKASSVAGNTIAHHHPAEPGPQKKSRSGPSTRPTVAPQKKLHGGRSNFGEGPRPEARRGGARRNGGAKEKRTVTIISIRSFPEKSRNS